MHTFDMDLLVPPADGPEVAVLDLGALMAPGDATLAATMDAAFRDADFDGPVPMAGPALECGFSAWIAGILSSRTGLGTGVLRPLVRAVYRDFSERLAVRCRVAPPSLRAGACQVLAELQAEGIRVALDSPWEPEVAASLVTGFGWVQGREFDVLVTPDPGIRGRPEPDLLREAAGRVGGSDPGRVVKLVGGPLDAAAARAFGCRWSGSLPDALPGGIAEGAVALPDLGDFAERILQRRLV